MGKAGKPPCAPPPAGPSRQAPTLLLHEEADVSRAPTEPAFQLHHLPPDALARVMQQLSVRDIHNTLLASKELHSALQDERVWHGLCVACWGGSTDAHRWLAPALPPVPVPVPGTPTRVTLPAPQTYRKLYMLLHESAPIVGLWRLVGEGPRSALIRFSWARDGIEGTELECRSPLTGKTDASFWARLCPARGLTTSVVVDPDGRHATVRVHSGQGSRLHKSPSAEAAAAVAIPGACLPSASPLGTSPKGSFEHEWLEFMSGNVQHSRSKQRKRLQRSQGQARGEGPTVYHLKRVAELAPTSKHPHVGLWAADYGPQGFEVLQLRYDFKGRAAQLHAVKVTGDDCVPAGQCSWQCQAAPMPTPWPSAEQQLVQQQEERWLQEQEWFDEDDDEDADSGSSASGSDDSSPSGLFAASMAGLPGTNGTTNNNSGGGKGPPQVVAVHEGSGQVAEPGFSNPQWVAGRLLVFADGSLSFVWLEGMDQVTQMRRLRWADD